MDDSHSTMVMDLSLNEDVHAIENKVHSMTLAHQAEMFQNSCSSKDFGYDLLRNTSVQSVSDRCNIGELSESAKAFLQFQKEREDSTFSRSCLFCKKHFTGNRSLLLDHFTEQHNFFMGQPDNLVYIEEFLNILDNMLNKLQCIFCEKLFKDWSALKEHMRKKMHKRINPDNKIFDKFYMSNYLDMFNTMDFTYHDADEEREIEVEPKDEAIICLFCDCKHPNFDEIINHLKVVHDFDFGYLKKQYKLGFYSQIKLINYIRQKVVAMECTICDTPFKSKEALARHLTVSRHIRLLPPETKWDQSEYFFSTLDSDYLLCGLLDDDDDDGNDSANVEIISEDIIVPEASVLKDENLRMELL